MRAIQLYLNNINQQTYSENGQRLAHLLSLSHSHVESLLGLNLNVRLFHYIYISLLFFLHHCTKLDAFLKRLYRGLSLVSKILLM